ncbi:MULTISPECIES: hypothetical protein [Vibrio harveyi group]|nr:MULTISPECIES: hypothetical protein [Vibrio harveyi group]
MKWFVLCLALTLSACASSPTPPPKPDYHHAPVEKINHDVK